MQNKNTLPEGAAKNFDEESFVQKAYELFGEFYRATAAFRRKCIDNEEYWKANHWHDVEKKDIDEPRPVTPVLFSTLESMLADVMDNYPEPVLLGEEPGDDTLALQLGDIIKFILKRRGYRETYRAKCRQALKKGASVQEVYWDKSLYNGLGDINMRSWDIKNFLWDTKSEDIQEGRACFKFRFYPKEWYKQRYPSKVDEFKPDGYTREGFDPYNKDEDIMLIEYWYRRHDSKTGKTFCHMALLAGNTLLERSEAIKPEGMYSHGKYPFIVESVFPIEGQPVGLGFIDIFKNLQMYADKLDQIIMKNALMSGRVKMLINRGADLDEAALCDWSKEIVRGNRIDDASLRWIQPQQLSPAVMNHFYNKLQTIKDESGQTQYNRGEAGKGITAAAAILALQEAGNKRIRMVIDGMYDGFEQMVRMIIALIEEFYSESRRFRLQGDNGEYTAMFGSDLLRRDIGGGLYRNVEFDISVHVQKQTPYRTLYQNELAMDLLKAGVLQPNEALELMTFEGKDKALASVNRRALQPSLLADGDS